ncbi:MAG TPA: LysR family transcriptional regulator [Mycobacteriales bacterium]|nr:LysR family transcriptional regulator [Mycobacteriales bacterium]
MPSDAGTADPVGAAYSEWMDESTDALSVLAPRLRQFAAVAEEQHVTRAAARLGMPQPTVSRTIARLETDLGVRLFARHGRGVTLTRQGRILLVHVRRALAELAAGHAEMVHDASPTRGRVAFAFLHTLGAESVPALLRDFRAAQPGIRFTLVQDGAAGMLARLRAGEVDMCLTSPLPDEPGIATRALQVQPLDLIVPPDHRLAHRRRVRLGELAADDFVCLEPGYGLRRISDELCQRAGFTPKVSFEGQEVDIVCGLVAAGLGVALVPARAAEHSPAVALRVTEPPAERVIGLAWPTDRPETRPAAVFRQFLLDHPDPLLPR